MQDDGVVVSSSITIDEDVKLEHVEVVFTAEHPHRGDLYITLLSPMGTESVFSEPRPDYGSNYPKWKFMSVFCWGESSKGTWTLNVSDRKPTAQGTFVDWNLRVFVITK